MILPKGTQAGGHEASPGALELGVSEESDPGHPETRREPGSHRPPRRVKGDVSGRDLLLNTPLRPASPHLL